MAYRIALSDTSIEMAVRRIAIEQLDAALGLLASNRRASATSIHGIRKHIKRLRGLIRLVQPGFDDFALENTSLRDIGRGLAGLRDSDVLVLTLNSLSKGSKSFPTLRTALKEHHKSARDPQETGATLTTATAALTAMRLRAEGWTIDTNGDGIKTARRGLRNTYCAAARRLATLRRDPTDERVHDWRKRVKDSYYQMLLIEPLWPEVIGPRTKAADMLGEVLGNHHDLSVLAAHAATLPLPQAEAAALASHVSAAQNKLLKTALPLGSRLFAGDAGAVANIWADWWTIWRG